MLSGIGQGRSFPCASSATGLPAMVGSSTIDTTGNFCWAVVVAVSSRAKAMRTAWVSRFMGKDVRRCIKSARPRYGMMTPATTCRTRKENLGDAVVGQRTVFVEIESFIELGKRGGEVSLLLQRLSAQNRSVELHIG